MAKPLIKLDFIFNIFAKMRHENGGFSGKVWFSTTPDRETRDRNCTTARLPERTAHTDNSTSTAPDRVRSPDRITMLGLSRWAERGGSYRTIQRFYQTAINWVQVHWTLIQTHLLGSSGPYLLAGDEVVVSKAGQQTHGVGRFYSGLAQSYPLQIERGRFI